MVGDEFSIGLPAELNVHARGYSSGDTELSTVTCPDGSCITERAKTTYHPRGGWYVTALRPSFRLHIEGATYDGVRVNLDRDLAARVAPFTGDHDGAGPSMAVVEGTTLTWGLGPRDVGTVWDADRMTLDVSGAFERIDFPTFGTQFVNVRFRARDVGDGTVSLHIGALDKSYRVKAVALADVTKVHVAPVINAFEDQRPLGSIVLDRVELGVTTGVSSDEGGGRFWIVFETRTGEMGIASARSATPDPFGHYVLAPPPLTSEQADPPFLRLLGQKPGTSKLQLTVGAATAAVDVVVR
jgi:hypothetical protein